MEITDELLEYATIQRMRDMLVNVDKDYKVTHSYALFTTILCWVMQRVRTRGNARIDLKAKSVFQALIQEPIELEPWLVPTTAIEGVDGRIAPGPFEDFQGFDAGRFLLALRHATAHGDARNIRPINRDHFLVGHEFHCQEKDRQQNIEWEGRIVLLRDDMRRIGCALADRYCAAMEEPKPDIEQSNVAEKAKLIREDAA